MACTVNVNLDWTENTGDKICLTMSKNTFDKLQFALDSSFNKLSTEPGDVMETPEFRYICTQFKKIQRIFSEVEK